MGTLLDPRQGWTPPAGHPEAEAVAGIAARLRECCAEAPGLAIILGSGLSTLLDDVEVEARVPYAALGLRPPGVAGHAGAMVVGKLGQNRLAFFAGRAHLYEGVRPPELARMVRAAHLWGVGGLLLTASVGGISRDLQAGDLVDVTDSINLMGASCLEGPPWGERFPDMSCPCHPALRARLASAAEAEGIALRRGVYAALRGPAYETAAEIRMLATLGAAVVGMSVVPELHACAEIGLPVAALALVSNLATGVSEGPLDHAEVIAAAGNARGRLVRLLGRL